MSQQLSLLSPKFLIADKAHYTYYPNFLDNDTANKLFSKFIDLEWQQNSINISGENVLIPRKECLYGDKNCVYKYGTVFMEAKPWNKDLLFLRDKIKDVSEYQFNIVYGNLYRDGRDSIGWHSDGDEKMGIDPAIASFSFGATRKFKFMSKAKQTESLWLEHGSLLIMKPGCQRSHLHSIPKTTDCSGQRINLTFRPCKTT